MATLFKWNYSMIRSIFFISLILLIFILFSNTDTTGKDIKPDACVKCHEKIYMEALDNPYQHSVVKDKCELCHIAQEVEDEQKTIISFPTFQKEGIFYLDKIQNDQKYRIEIIVADNAERNSKPYYIDIIPEEVEEYSEEFSSLKQISGITLEEIKKGVFVKAVISWATDVPATSEIEYSLRERHILRVASENQFTKKHKIILNGLKHKHKYYYRIVSRDTYGNLLKSREYNFDTSENYTPVKESEENDLSLPFINKTKVFRIENAKGIYLMVSANKPSTLSVLLEEIQARKIDKKHGPGLAPARYSRIDVCKQCHFQNASHPVGIRAEGEKVKTPDDLPTIEGGMITCVTCHFPHGGKEVYFARMDLKKDICIKCHISGSKGGGYR